MSTPPQIITPGQALRADAAQYVQAIQKALYATRVATPAFLVEDMDPTTQTVRVQVAIQERLQTVSGSEWWDIPPIGLVPVVLPRGGGWTLTFPLKAGDEGLLVFCDTCFDLWWQNGQDNAPAAANASVNNTSGTQQQLEIRRHHVHDCGFIPGMWSQPNTLSGYSTSSVQLRSDDGSISLDLSTANGITLTANKLSINATGQVAITGSAVSIMGKDFLTHEHTGVTTGGGITGGVAP